MERRRRRWVAVGLGAIAVVLAVITFGPGWSSVFTGPELAVVKSDPMASLDLPGAEEISRREENAGTTLGKPTSARVVVRYRISGDPEAVLESAVAAAELNGWQGDHIEAEYYSADRPVDEGTLELIVAISEQSDEPGLFLSVNLRR
jgi:hypothetical protein